MNKFNMVKSFGMKILFMPVPKGAFYGKDQWGVWICIHKERYPFEKNTLELYRWNCERIGWVLTIEQSPTVDYICQCADKYNLWEIPIEYNKYEGIHEIAANLHQNPRASQKKSYKTVAQDYYQRGWFRNTF